MPMRTQPRLTPEAEHLVEQERLLEELTEQLTAKEAEFAETGSAFARFRVEYLRRFAPLYAELDRLEAEIARRIAQEEETPAAHAKAADATARADETQRALDDGLADIADADEETGPATPAPELKALYRDAAKRIHPDLATEEAEKERRHTLMAALNAAYAAGDADAIQRILNGEASRPEAITGDDIGARLMRAIRRNAQVRGRFTELVELTEALRSDPLFVLFEASRADWASANDPLAADEASLRERIASAHARLATLVMAAAKRPTQAGA
jgi:hypothetical protein